MRTISSTEAKAIRDILLVHEARTLSPGCDDPDNLNIMLDHLRLMLMGVRDQEVQPKEDAVKAIGQLIRDEDEDMDAMTDPQKVGEKVSYILGLAKALSLFQAV